MTTQRPDRPMFTCPKCATLIDPSDRCTAKRGVMRCVDRQGHHGWHWYDNASKPPSITRWTGLYVVRSCASALNPMRWCEKEPGHEGMHTDKRGTSWGDEESDESKLPEPDDIPTTGAPEGYDYETEGLGGT